MSIPSLRAGLLCALTLVTVLVPLRAEAGATIDGQFADLGLRSAGMTTVLPVLGRGGVPGDAVAVALNVTSTGSLAEGFVTVFPCGMPRPNASNLNVAPGVTVANAVTAKVGVGGAVCIYNQSPTHLVVDVNGYYLPSSGYGALDPSRLLDSRGSVMADAGMTTVLPVLGRGGVPGDAVAVALNVTSTGSLAEGFVTVFPCGMPRPNASNLNVAPGVTVANAVTAKVGVGGAVCIYNQSPTHLVVDVNGYHSARSGYRAVDPARLADTRRASAAATAEDMVLILVNQLRASWGLGSVASDATMTSYARNWSYTMSQSGFRHSSGPYAENIGWVRGTWVPESAALVWYNAFVASPPHLANMLDPAWTQVGVGVHFDGTTGFVTLEFR